MASQYIFLPWMRRGLAKQIADTDPLAGNPALPAQAIVPVPVSILADDVKKNTVNQQVTLIGPGDITGISRSAVVKTEPAAGTGNFEPNFFPYIEFYEEDFLWRYTPAKATGNHRLRPWITLVTLEESEFKRITDRSTANRIIHISADAASVLPAPEQTWAWSHVQVNDGNINPEDLTTDDLRNQKIAGTLSVNPSLGVARLLCPRKLKANTLYFAFLLPAFERGRIAGLGGSKADIDAAGRLLPAWGSTQTFKPGQHPVYYEWSFKTGAEDFEALAKKITPVDLTGTEVGRLWMDCSNINYGEKFDYKGNLEPDNTATDRTGFLLFEGALRLPGSATPNLAERTGEKEKEFVENLSTLVNLGVQYREKPKEELGWSIGALGNTDDDPMLVPPVYGRWYVRPDGAATLNPQLSGNWLEQLNLDPALRVAAGLGTEVIKEHQEEYMSRAWEQLADYRKNLNQELLRLRFAQEVTRAAFIKHFAHGGTDDEAASNVLALTQSLHTIVKSNEDSLSVAGKLSGYKTDTAFVQPVYRRMTRSSGPLIKRLNTKSFYKSVVMSGSMQFSTLDFIMMTFPQFQNFASVSVKLVTPDKFKYMPGPWPNTALMLEHPNWFGDRLNFFLIARTRFPVIVQELLDKVLPRPVLVKPVPANIQQLSFSVMAKIQPAASFKTRFAAALPANTAPAIAGSETISPNSFNPFFSEPTFERLGQLRPELFIPNLDLLKPESFVLLQANSAFIEAYLAGLNHEMGAEFLWRGYPADLNATYFRQFWDTSDNLSAVADKSDIKPMRFWETKQRLGKNGPPGAVENPLVFVIKAELVRKYPNLVVYAQKAMLNGEGFRVPDKNVEPLSPIFLSNLSPDYLFAGFDLSKDKVLGKLGSGVADGGWYFVIAERPGEMHFGLDQSRPVNEFVTWNDLAWTDLPAEVAMVNLEKHIPLTPPENGGLQWGKAETVVTADPAGGTGNAAQMAAILQQRPVQIFIHASMMVT